MLHNLVNTLEDKDLIAQIKETGDPKLVGTLYNRYIHHVFNVAYKYLKDKEEAQDAVMHIYEVLVKDIPRYEIRNFGGWLLMVTRNHCLKVLRKSKRTREKQEKFKNFQEDRMEWSDDPTHNAVEEREIKLSNLEAAISELKEEQRACIKLFYLDQKCYNEVAESTGYSLKQVKSYIQNGKRNLKIILTTKYGQSI